MSFTRRQLRGVSDERDEVVAHDWKRLEQVRVLKRWLASGWICFLTRKSGLPKLDRK